VTPAALTPLIAVDVRHAQDVVACRQLARQVAALLGFSPPEQTSVATAVSEVARNAFRYAGGGRVEFAVGPDDEGGGAGGGGGGGGAADGHPLLLVRVADTGPGIADLQAVLDGRHRSAAGTPGAGTLGTGLAGARRLSDRFAVASTPGAGTTVTLGRRLPKRGADLTDRRLAAVAAELAVRPPATLVEEVQQQNTELLRAMADLQARQAEVERLNAELAETNRGVLALYAELDEKAASLERASAYKSRFLSDMTHELRTPLNAMVSLSGLLLDRTDGDLTAEQETQVSLIRRSAVSLSQMVDDLLDLAKIEAGKVDLRVSAVDVGDLLAALRGIFRPLVPAGGRVRLVVDDPPAGLGPLHTDEQKVSQVLRNLVSNALKFTEHGEVRVWVEPAGDPAVGGDGAIAAGANVVRFRVSDTGIGIAAADQPRIFDDFTQVDSSVQRRVRGTGLGLPLSRKLARLLGGEVGVVSEPGRGSTFTLVLPAGDAGAGGGSGTG
jgi:signal transduction histidine kinase